ncbi:toll/interleukin-1 receptor domain-containing protein [Streptomyces sp. NPDC058964]|uniref:toll/interleukin-1 receptor domain-containing protein n=1 Tax=Streptomyces sp. NPDC058964 TaxID=3346681 RepID=UPI00368502E4
MVRPKIFVSHSSSARKCAAAGCDCVAYRDAFAALLTERGCEPVIDQDVLRAGDQWHEKLNRELFDCQGAVLLLSPHALESDYVLQEAIVSLALWEVTGRRFLVLPVLLPGVRRSDLDGSPLNRLGLGRFDMVDWAGADGPAHPPDKVGHRLRPLVEEYGALPYHSVTEYVAGRIGDVSGTILSRIARELGVQHIAYAHDHANYVVSAGLLMERPAAAEGTACAMRAALRELLPHLRHKEHRQDVVDVVVPFARVPSSAARALRMLSDTVGEGRVALLSAQRTLTGEMYVRRASEAPEPWLTCTPVPRPGMDFVDGVITEIRDFLIDRFFAFDTVEDEQLNRWLAREEAESGPVTIVLGVQPDDELVRRLLSVFPRLLFLFAHSHVDTYSYASQHMRLSALTPDQEYEMLYTHNRLRR